MIQALKITRFKGAKKLQRNLENKSDLYTITLDYIAIFYKMPINSLTDLNINTGDVTYTPNRDYTGSDSFKFKTNDSELDSPAGTVSIDVAGSNDGVAPAPPTNLQISGVGQ